MTGYPWAGEDLPERIRDRIQAFFEEWGWEPRIKALYLERAYFKLSDLGIMIDEKNVKLAQLGVTVVGAKRKTVTAFVDIYVEGIPVKVKVMKRVGVFEGNEVLPYGVDKEPRVMIVPLCGGGQ